LLINKNFKDKKETWEKETSDLNGPDCGWNFPLIKKQYQGLGM
jgi:hypothetical protein